MRILLILSLLAVGCAKNGLDEKLRDGAAKHQPDDDDQDAGMPR